MGEDLRRAGLAVVDQIAEAAVIGFDVALAGPHLLSFEPELAKVKGDLPFLC